MVLRALTLLSLVASHFDWPARWMHDKCLRVRNLFSCWIAQIIHPVDLRYVSSFIQMSENMRHHHHTRPKCRGYKFLWRMIGLWQPILSVLMEPTYACARYTCEVLLSLSCKTSRPKQPNLIHFIITSYSDFDTNIIVFYFLSSTCSIRCISIEVSISMDPN